MVKPDRYVLGDAKLVSRYCVWMNNQKPPGNWVDATDTAKYQYLKEKIMMLPYQITASFTVTSFGGRSTSFIKMFVANLSHDPIYPYQNSVNCTKRQLIIERRMWGTWITRQKRRDGADPSFRCTHPPRTFPCNRHSGRRLVWTEIQFKTGCWFEQR